MIRVTSREGSERRRNASAAPSETQSKRDLLRPLRGIISKCSRGTCMDTWESSLGPSVIYLQAPVLYTCKYMTLGWWARHRSESHSINMFQLCLVAHQEQLTVRLSLLSTLTLLHVASAPAHQGLCCPPPGPSEPHPLPAILEACCCSVASAPTTT